MKKLYIVLSVMAFAAINARGGMLIEHLLTLDLSNPTVPSEITYAGNEWYGEGYGYWDGTYSEDVKWMQFGEFLVSHTLGSSWGGTYWDGFTVARNSDTMDHSLTKDGGWLTHQWSNIAGGGIKSVEAPDAWWGYKQGADPVVDDEGYGVVDRDAPFLVANWGFYDGAPQQTNQIKLVDGSGFYVLDAFVTNSTWVYYAVENGECPPARAFTEGDSFKLIAHGEDYGGREKTAEIELAWHDGKLHRLNKWTYWNLSSLGWVKSLYFTVESTDTGDWGMNTPAYFCIDKLRVEYYIDTPVEDVEGSKTVADVRYVNMAGQESQQPFEGVNVVVTRYTDGSTSTTKVVR
ncbi:MAG: DUF4465 domain-containing protein [Muribaculaceae bacterium]|nr:DUF4465 domain-containing protein [Muribaculaceae bacterium]